MEKYWLQNLIGLYSFVLSMLMFFKMSGDELTPKIIAMIAFVLTFTALIVYKKNVKRANIFMTAAILIGSVGVYYVFNLH